MNKYTEEVKEKIKKFSEEPGRVFGLVYPFILTLVIILGFYYVMNLNYSARQNVNPALPDSTVITDIPVSQARTIPPVDIKVVGISTPELINKGKGLYQANCVSCHGEQGTGVGPASVGLNPAPRNFTVIEGWKNGSKVSQIYTTLQEGIPGTAMAPYELLTPEEKLSIAHYIRGTFVSNAPQDSPEDFAAIDQLYSLSKGQEVPAQIPVSAAEKLFLAEKDTNIQMITRRLDLINSSSDEGQKIFTSIINNKFKAVSYLGSSSNWRRSEKDFLTFVSMNVNQNGFNGRVFNLKRDELNKLYGFVTKVF